jgi:hypothetical protein
VPYKSFYVIWDPAPNLVVGRDEEWSERDARQFLEDHPDSFSVSAKVYKDEEAP